MSEVKITDLLERMKQDETWCEDAGMRNALVNKLIYFIIEN